MNDRAGFARAIWENYRDNGRRFPWRETRDPYEILVSEFMLQQTQTVRVVPKYLAWLARFPDPDSVSRAPLSEILTYWSGLGYNRRARYLREACGAIVGQYGGKVPGDPAVLASLPGIGPYTAAAVATFSYGLPLAFIETNIRAVFMHFFFQGMDAVRDREILALVGETLDRENPREWYYALMDYGAELKRAVVNPNRKSAHYRKQDAFKGSNREARGAVLRRLTSQGECTAESIAEAEALDPERIRRALSELIGEGFVAERGEGYGLA